jgi:hypothetical protein
MGNPLMGTNVATLPGAGQAVAAPRYRGVVLEGMDDSLRMAKVIVASGMAPKSYFTNANVDPVAAVFTAMQLGAEIGLTPMAAVQNIAVINGKPGLYGPAMLAVVEASGLLKSIDEGVEGEGDARHGYCVVERVGRKPKRVEFFVTDAKRAKLISKPGPWSEYPDRMLMARARSFALRDVFPDVLLGLAHSAEELGDIAMDAPAIEHRPAPAPPPPPPPPPAISKGNITVSHDGRAVGFPRTREGIAKALDHIAAGGAALVMQNNDLLDKIATMEVFAERVADIRGRAAAELAPAEEWPGQHAGAEPPEPDEWTDAIAILRGDRPASMTDAEASGLPE